ncbi:MAG: glycosyltransferase family 9 protein [Candidatus Aminicenantales bacterium]
MIKDDCLYFRGEKPCRFKILCDNCSHYQPFPTRILIIKCAAQGDVLRTTPLLSGLKRKYPQSHINWLVAEESKELLTNNSSIDKIITFNLNNLIPLVIEEFDILICLDKEPSSTSIATLIKAPQKFGFGLNKFGNLIIFNKASEYAYRLGIDDSLKFQQNKKTYQQIIYEMAELDYQRDTYQFYLRKEDKKKAEDFYQKNKISKKKLAVGLNTGSGKRFKTKQWPQENFLKLIHYLKTDLKANVFLLGGQAEKAINSYLARKSAAKVYNTGHDNSLREFAGFIAMMDVVVSSDTLAMHLAIALKKRVVALFGPTAPQEIDLYGRGIKIFAGVPCSPCYLSTCPDGKCMKAITPELVLEKIKTII